MNDRELRYITMVADCRSVTAAAKKLYISQPSLSYIVSKVEDELGVSLFDRKSYPLKLTYAGEKYVETARRILLMNENMKRELMDIGLGEKGCLNFGIPTERTGHMLPRVLPRYRELFPRVEIRVHEGMSDELLEACLKDEIDFFILPRKKEDLPSGLTTEVVYREHLFLVASPELLGEQCRGGRVELSAFAGQPFILIKKGHAIRKKSDAVFKKYHIVPNVFMEVSSCISAAQLAMAGLGVTIVPERAIDALGGRTCVPCASYSEEPDCWDVNVTYKEDVYLDRAERSFIELMKDVFLTPQEGG